MQLGHGDLHAQNALVTGGTRPPTFRFVDYDSLWLPGLTVPPPEVGHAAFRHPQRAWGEHMDAFGAAVVYLSLRAAAAQPELWELHSSDMTLLVDESDLEDDGRGLWARLGHSPDHVVREMATELRLWCDRPFETYTSLERLLDVIGSPRNRWPPVPPPSRPATSQTWTGFDATKSSGSGKEAPRLQTWGAHQAPSRSSSAPPPPPPPGAPSPTVPPAKASSSSTEWWVLLVIVVVLVVLALSRMGRRRSDDAELGARASDDELAAFELDEFPAGIEGHIQRIFAGRDEPPLTSRVSGRLGARSPACGGDRRGARAAHRSPIAVPLTTSGEPAS